jgi:hypothetical protein
MPESPRCTKVLHPTRESAQEHADRLKADGYDMACVYPCRHCPFWHVTKGEKRGKVKTRPRQHLRYDNQKQDINTPKWARKLIPRRDED